MDINDTYKHHLKTQTQREAFKLTLREASGILIRMEEWEKPEIRKDLSSFIEKHCPVSDSVTSGVCQSPIYSIAS